MEVSSKITLYHKFTPEIIAMLNYYINVIHGFLNMDLQQNNLKEFARIQIHLTTIGQSSRQ